MIAIFGNGKERTAHEAVRIRYEKVIPNLSSPLCMLEIYNRQYGETLDEVKPWLRMEIDQVKRKILEFEDFVNDRTICIPFRDKQIIRLRYLYHLPWEQIANTLYISRDTVMRTRKRWVGIMKEHGLLLP